MNLTSKKNVPHRMIRGGGFQVGLKSGGWVSSETPSSYKPGLVYSRYNTRRPRKGYTAIHFPPRRQGLHSQFISPHDGKGDVDILCPPRQQRLHSHFISHPDSTACVAIFISLRRHGCMAISSLLKTVGVAQPTHFPANLPPPRVGLLTSGLAAQPPLAE